MFQAVPGMSFQPGHTILFDFCFAVFLNDKKICKSFLRMVLDVEGKGKTWKVWESSWMKMIF